MKSFWIAIFLLSIISCTPKGVHKPDLTVVNATAFSFFKVSSGTTISLSATESNITLAFGNPSIKTPGVSEFNHYPNTKWIYKGATIYLQAGRMVNIDLKSSAYGFFFNGSEIRVGEDINKLKTMFPLSFSSKSTSQIMVGLNYNGEPVDCRILFAFNKQNLITSISLVCKKPFDQSGQFMSYQNINDE